jgi:hypothetical protein
MIQGRYEQSQRHIAMDELGNNDLEPSKISQTAIPIASDLIVTRIAFFCK